MTEGKHAGGRPALPQGEKRKNWNLDLNDQELATIEAAATRAGQKPRVWAREALLKTAQEQVGESEYGNVSSEPR